MTGFIKDPLNDFPRWDGTHIAALGTSAGGTVLLESIADAVENAPDNKPDVTATWSATTEFGVMDSKPTGDGWDSEDSCDHAKEYHQSPYSGGSMEHCWIGENHYMDAEHTQLGTYDCGFDGTNGKVDPDHSDITGGADTCTTDVASWDDASPQSQWFLSNETDFGPVFIANGGGPYDPLHPENYLYEDAETVAITDAYDFRVLLSGNGWLESELTLCVVNDPAHGTHYEDKSCNEGGTNSVLDRTAAFFLSQWT